MARLRPIIRYFLLSATVGVLAAIFYGVVGEFFVELARENGWYENPSLRIERTITWVAEHVSRPWFIAASALLFGLTIGSWMDYSLRKRLPNVQTIAAPADIISDPELYTYDPAYQIQDSSAYYDLMEFTLSHVIPTCEQQILLHQAIIRRLSKDEKIAKFAIDGMRFDLDKSTRTFWANYDSIIRGVDSSEPTIKFDALVSCIDGLERGSYRSFCTQSDELMKSANISLRNDSELRQIWNDWREKHNALISAYDRIKRNAKYEKLFRPLKKSRWGEIIDPIGPF